MTSFSQWRQKKKYLSKNDDVQGIAKDIKLLKQDLLEMIKSLEVSPLRVPHVVQRSERRLRKKKCDKKGERASDQAKKQARSRRDDTQDV